MASIAIIGVDGSGKTTVTRRLVRSSPYRFKYVYMGINVEACNFALPTLRWAGRLRQWADRKRPLGPAAQANPAARRSVLRLVGSKLWAAARLANRLADEWYRQIVSWYYQSRGFVVLYDRHFVFDFSEDPATAAGEPFDRRIHRWYLKRFYPLPDLVIFLDAPPEVLYARKPEWPLDNLKRKRETLIRLGTHLPNFHRVDATQPLQTVYAQVVHEIGEFLANHGSFPRLRMPLASPAAYRTVYPSKEETPQRLFPNTHVR